MNSDYLWLVISGGFFCAAMGWGIGANDVANFYGTSVGAKAISLRYAMILAFIFEFIGAFFLGSTVANTIRKGITDFDLYEGEEDLLMLGMFTSLTAAAIWCYLATKYSLPVSTTQSIIGAIIGFALISKGKDGVHWDKVTEIITFWVFTPLMTFTACSILWLPSKYFLKKDGSYELNLKIYPIWVFLVFFVMLWFYFVKGLKNVKFFKKNGIWNNMWIALCVAIFIALVSYFCLIKTGVVQKFVEKRIAEKKEEENDVELNRVASLSAISSSKLKNSKKSEYEKTSTDDKKDTDTTKKNSEENDEKKQEWIKNVTMKGLNVDVHAGLKENELDLYRYSEKIDSKTEESFSWLQVLSACFGIFAHGSNDVANCVGPFSAVLALYKNPSVSKKNDIETWVLFMGSIAMSIGCVTYGYNVIRTLGVKVTAISQTRGYFTQISAALIIIVASALGIPASSTHCQTGSTIAIGFSEIIRSKSNSVKLKQVLNLKLVGLIFFGWILTIVVAGSTSAILYYILSHSPCSK